MKKLDLQSLSNLLARRGIVIPSSSAYGELGGFYDYGPIGLRVRKRIEENWRSFFIDGMGNYEIETAIVGPQAVFEASGHLSKFNDPISVCKKCGNSHRADKLLEEYFTRKKDLKAVDSLKSMSNSDFGALLKEHGIKCEKCGEPLSDVESFNLMLGTKIGASGKIQGYMRPETAQGIFLDFKDIFRIYGLKLPVGIGQVGKVYRNEISPRNMLLRMREFSQMELEYFFDPDDKELEINGEIINDSFKRETINFFSREDQKAGKGPYSPITIGEGMETGMIPNALFGYLVYMEKMFVERLGFGKESIRFRQALEDELPHYSRGNIDLEANLGNGFEEIAGNAYRTDFDLGNHEKHSNKDFHVVNGDRKILPHVVELSFGWDRLFYCLMYDRLYHDEERGWDVLLLNMNTAPFDFAVFPLQKDDGLIAEAMKINKELIRMGYKTQYSASGSIGKRYAKADEIGINHAITVDYKTLEDGTVTVRNISDAKQERIGKADISKVHYRL
jgi:glycyl-tRNA synthetase